MKVANLLFITILLDIIAFSAILPLFPIILEYYQIYENKIENSVYRFYLNYIGSLCEKLQIPVSESFINVLLAGTLGSLFSLLQFLSAPFCGHLSDHYGRKPILLISLIGIAISYVIWSRALSFNMFLLSRCIGGLFKSNISLATTIATDISAPNERGKIMAMIGAAFSFGFIIGPLIGGIMASSLKRQSQEWQYTLQINEVEKSNIYPFLSISYFSLVLAVINILIVWTYLPETLKLKEQPKDSNGHSKNGVIERDISSSKETTSVKTVMDYINPVSLFTFKPCDQIIGKKKLQLQALGLVYFSYLFFFSGMEYTLTFFTHARFNYNSMEQGKMFSFIGIIMVLVQGGLARKIPARLESSVAYIALILIILANLIIALSFNRLTFYFGLLIYSISTSMAVPTLTSLVSYYGDQRNRGILMGIHRSLGALARALGPFLFSIVFWRMGPTYSYMIGSILQIIPPYIFYQFHIASKSPKLM